MERGRARVPELDNEREETMRRQPPRRSEESRRGLVKRLFDRGVDGGKPPGVKRPVISAPSAPQKVMTAAPGFPYAAGNQQARPAPPRPVRPPVELTPAGATPEMAALRQAREAAMAIPRKPVAINRENLGTAAHALRSHPVQCAESDDGMATRARKTQNRKTAFVAGRQGGSILEMHAGRAATPVAAPLGLAGGEDSEWESEAESTEMEEKKMEMEMEQPAPLVRRNAESGNSARAERRRGMVIDRKPLAPFAEPAVAEAARQEREEKKAEAKPQQGVPTLVLTPPREATPPPVVKTGHLTTDYPYKRLVKQAQRKAELVAMEFEPLARALCTAGGLESVEDAKPDDLLRVLDQIIGDAEELSVARETVLDPLAKDGKLAGPARRDPEALGKALRTALGDRDQAIHAAKYHKRRVRELKARVAELEAAAWVEAQAGEESEEVPPAWEEAQEDGEVAAEEIGTAL